ncbi:hypothetical protein PCURB6_27270 [Paenibacillus curdlanolyticus]|nr:hypothetical protein PCURB6_27270 [Paenibacillus curdlanolyticus]
MISYLLFLYKKLKCLLGFHFLVHQDRHNVPELGVHEREYYCIRCNKVAKVIKLIYSSQNGFEEEIKY